MRGNTELTLQCQKEQTMFLGNKREIKKQKIITLKKQRIMKTSKLLILTFIGLLFTIMDVGVDLINRDSLVSAEQLHATAKAYVQKYISNSNETYTKIQEDIAKANYESGANNNNDMDVNNDALLAEANN